MRKPDKPDKTKQEKPTASLKEKSTILSVHIRQLDKPILNTSESDESEKFLTSR
jgi:hypothetical protein